MERPFRASGLAGFDTLGDAQGWYGAGLWPSKTPRAMGSYRIISHLELGAAEVIRGFSVDDCCGMERPFRALGLAGFDTLGDAQGWYGAGLWPSKPALPVPDDAQNPFVLVYLRGAPHDWLRVAARIGWTRLVEIIRLQ